jgi:hypothetical protein
MALAWVEGKLGVTLTADQTAGAVRAEFFCRMCPIECDRIMPLFIRRCS